MPSTSGIQMSSSTRSGRMRSRRRAPARRSRPVRRCGLRRSGSPTAGRGCPVRRRQQEWWPWMLSAPAAGSTADAAAAAGAGCRARISKMIAKLAPRATAGRVALAVRAEVGDAHARAVFVGDLLDHRQAQAGALGLGRHVGLEGALEHLVGEAGPVVDAPAAAPRAARPARCARPRCARAPGRRAARPPRRARSAPGCGSPGAAAWRRPRSPAAPAPGRRAAGPAPAPWPYSASTSRDQRVQVQRRQAARPAGARSRGTR